YLGAPPLLIRSISLSRCSLLPVTGGFPSLTVVSIMPQKFEMLITCAIARADYKNRSAFRYRQSGSEKPNNIWTCPAASDNCNQRTSQVASSKDYLNRSGLNSI